jgi:hypothetical protein
MRTNVVTPTSVETVPQPPCFLCTCSCAASCERCELSTVVVSARCLAPAVNTLKSGVHSGRSAPSPTQLMTTPPGRPATVVHDLGARVSHSVVGSAASGRSRLRGRSRRGEAGTPAGPARNTCRSPRPIPSHCGGRSPRHACSPAGPPRRSRRGHDGTPSPRGRGWSHWRSRDPALADGAASRPRGPPDPAAAATGAAATGERDRPAQQPPIVAPVDGRRPTGGGVRSSWATRCCNSNRIAARSGT